MEFPSLFISSLFASSLAREPQYREKERKCGWFSKPTSKNSPNDPRLVTHRKVSRRASRLKESFRVLTWWFAWFYNSFGNSVLFFFHQKNSILIFTYQVAIGSKWGWEWRRLFNSLLFFRQGLEMTVTVYAQPSNVEPRDWLKCLLVPTMGWCMFPSPPGRVPSNTSTTEISYSFALLNKKYLKICWLSRPDERKVVRNLLT